MVKNTIAKIQDFFRCEFIIPVGSGTAGLYLSLKAAGVKGKKVLLPICTCPDVAIAVYAAGGIPVVVDISENDYNISPDSIRGAMDENVSAIIAVDSFGYPAQINKIKELVKAYQCTVIEDACQAYGGEVDGAMVGTRGDIGVVSFGYAKPIALNGGGFILTNSKEIASEINANISSGSFSRFESVKNDLAVDLMLKDRYKVFRWLSVHFNLLNYHFPEKQKKALEESWPVFEDNIERNKQCLNKVQELLASCNGIRTFDYQVGNWLPWRYSFKITESENRSIFEKLALQEGITCSRLYSPLTSYFKDLIVQCNMDRTSKLVSTIYNLTYEVDPDSIKMLSDSMERVLEKWSALREG